MKNEDPEKQCDSSGRSRPGSKVVQVTAQCVVIVGRGETLEISARAGNEDGDARDTCITTTD